MGGVRERGAREGWEGCAGGVCGRCACEGCVREGAWEGYEARMCGRCGIREGSE